ncbi:MAG: DUF2316 family protein [Streptococcaceae bacterium]|jgi:hypothetical protein|nr:DUF2316 family protein [Streptococcaceae bacterium]
MTLDETQRTQTQQDFARAIAKTQLTVEQIAAELSTTAGKIDRILALEDQSRENVWILRDYFLRKDETLDFTELPGNALDYWFLDQVKIKERRIS